MKTICIPFLSSILFLVTFNLSAQQNQPINDHKKLEVGASYSSNGIGLDVKKHWKNNKYLRLSNASINVRGSESNSATISSGFNIGIENRKYFDEKWWLSYGPELGIRSSFAVNNNSFALAYQIDFGYFAGINYDITDQVSVGFEIKPMIFTSNNFSSISGRTPNNSNRWGLQTISKVNLTYRF